MDSDLRRNDEGVVFPPTNVIPAKAGIHFSEARAVGPEDSDLRRNDEGVVFSPTNVIPAKAGIHFSEARSVEEWIPTFVGMTIYSDAE